MDGLLIIDSQHGVQNQQRSALTETLFIKCGHKQMLCYSVVAVYGETPKHHANFTADVQSAGITCLGM